MIFLNSTKQKHISIILILLASFLIESPLRATIISGLSFFQPLAYIVTSAIFYIALIGCFLIALKPNVTSKSVLKTICLVLGFFILEQIISALFCEIIRPLFILAVIIIVNHLVFKTKLNLNKIRLTILCSAFILGALFIVLEYIRVITVAHGIQNDFFSYLSILTSANSVYVILAKLCTYIFTFVLFI